MKKAGVLISVVFLVVIIGAAALFIVGCEDSEGTWPLIVVPQYVDLTVEPSNGVPENMSQTFVVTGGLRELSMPLVWTVSNPQLGYIGSSGGASASYLALDAHGDNAITVVDQYGAEGVATVRQ